MCDRIKITIHHSSWTGTIFFRICSSHAADGLWLKDRSTNLSGHVNHNRDRFTRIIERSESWVNDCRVVINWSVLHSEPICLVQKCRLLSSSIEHLHLRRSLNIVHIVLCYYVFEIFSKMRSTSSCIVVGRLYNRRVDYRSRWLREW